eukprot:SAG31_NODE_627_length_13445_cov_18.311053_8_plen_118_part_00
MQEYLYGTAVQCTCTAVDRSKPHFRIPKITTGTCTYYKFNLSSYLELLNLVEDSVEYLIRYGMDPCHFPILRWSSASGLNQKKIARVRWHDLPTGTAVPVPVPVHVLSISSAAVVIY